MAFYKIVTISEITLRLSFFLARNLSLVCLNVNTMPIDKTCEELLCDLRSPVASFATCILEKCSMTNLIGAKQGEGATCIMEWPCLMLGCCLANRPTSGGAVAQHWRSIKQARQWWWFWVRIWVKIESDILPVTSWIANVERLHLRSVQPTHEIRVWLQLYCRILSDWLIHPAWA